MSEYKIIKTVLLNNEKVSTNKTLHYKNNELLEKPAQLKIIQYPNDTGYYLLYFDDKENELTDTYHETLSKAYSQAEWEFNVKTVDWKEPT